MKNTQQRIKAALLKVLSFNTSFTVGVLTYEEAKEKLKGKEKLTIGNNTWLIKTNDGFGIKYHNTTVIEILPNDLYVLKSGGYQTSTTAIRINQLSPLRVYKVKHKWYYGPRDKKILFEEGMIVDKHGDVVG